MEKSYYKSLIGVLEITCKNNELISLKLVDNFEKTGRDNDFIKNIKAQLDEYFLGKRQKFEIRLNPIGTSFQKLVWKELEKIPYGTVKSYSEIAKNIGNPNSQRAVGNACNKNPIMIVIPCHRVIAKNGNLGGFAHGSVVKQKLIDIEHASNSAEI